MKIPDTINPAFLNIILKSFFAMFCMFLSHAALSQPTIVLNTAVGAPISNEDQTGFADQVAAEAFKRIGYQLETVRLQAERALINANRGIDDGDLMRVAGLQKRYPNLIQVPESIIDIDMVLFSKKYPSHAVTGWDSMVSYSLAIISGWKIMENNFGVYGSKIAITKTDNAHQSFTLLKKGRVDFMAYSLWSGLEYLKTRNITDIRLLHPPLASPRFYVYLHKKHKIIVPKFAAALREMKEDGTYQSMYDRLLKPYLKNKE